MINLDFLTDDFLKDLIRRIERIRAEIMYERKVANARASVAKAKANGSFLGRNKKRDDKLIWRLRKKGLTVRAIAKATGVSPSVVQRSLKERRE